MNTAPMGANKDLWQHLRHFVGKETAGHICAMGKVRSHLDEKLGLSITTASPLVMLSEISHLMLLREPLAKRPNRPCLMSPIPSITQLLHKNTAQAG